jgi:hypothetical protein
MTCHKSFCEITFHAASLSYRSMCIFIIFIFCHIRVLSTAHDCPLKVAYKGEALAINHTIEFFLGDTVRLKFSTSGSACTSCEIACRNCQQLHYSLDDGLFIWKPTAVSANKKIELKFSASCDSVNAVSIVSIKVSTFNYKFSFDFDHMTPVKIKSKLMSFFNNGDARVAQINVNEGDTLNFRVSTPFDGPGKLSLIQSFRSFDGVTYADNKSVVVRWIPSYKDYKRDPIHELRLGLSNDRLMNDPDQLLKSVKFRISLRNNISPIVDKSKSRVIALDTNGDTYINLADYFIPSYDPGDNPLQFDYSPNDLSCIKPSPYNPNELIIHKSLYLNSQPRPNEIKVKAKHSNSPYTEEIKLTLKDHFESLSMALENRKFTFYDNERIDEMVKAEFNEVYKLDKKSVRIIGDTAAFDLKNILRFDDQDPQYLRIFSTGKIEIDDSENRDLQYTVAFDFLNALGRISSQTISITLHPRVNGDIARLYYKLQVDSLKSFLDSVKRTAKNVESSRIRRGNRIDWFSKGVSFAAIIMGSYGAAKNPSNYGFSVMAGLGMGVLFVDLKQIKFFATKKYLRTKTTSEDLSRLQDETEKHLMADIDKMGASYFEANYRLSDWRDHSKLFNEFSEIMTRVY